MSSFTEFIIRCFCSIVKAIPLTIILIAVPMILGTIIGFLFAFARIKKVPLLSQFIAVYNSFFRSVPLLVLLFVGYYGLPKLLNVLIYHGDKIVGTKSINATAVALAVMTLYAAAFLGEIIRGAVKSVDYGQMEAGYVLGMTKRQAVAGILIPQAFGVALPNLKNFLLAFFKGSSVVFCIGVIDIMAAAKIEAEISYRYIEAYILVSLFYLAASILVGRISASPSE